MRIHAIDHLSPTTTRITFQNLKTCLISPDDLDLFERYQYAVINPNRNERTGYVARSVYRKGCVYLHREIAARVHGDGIAGLVIDHQNGDGTDNRRENLRPVTNAANCANVDAAKRAQRNRTGYVGVKQYSDGYVGSVCINYQIHSSRLMRSARAAAQYRDWLCVKYRGVDQVIARSLNFPELMDRYAALT